jgi:N-acetylneuraminic acid mutarotase
MREVRHLLPFACLGVFLVVAAGAVLPAGGQTTAPNEWTWVGGSNTGSPQCNSCLPGVYGTLGVFAAGNIPNGRWASVSWNDRKGNFWLFGGVGSTVDDDSLKYNDLWEFNPSTNEWAWMSGSSTGSQSGVYGTLGTPSTENVPGSREDASGWTDDEGNLWLFGGYGDDAGGTNGILNDLWEFKPSTSEWTWMSGSGTVGNSCFTSDSGETICAQPSVYGTLGTPAAGNTPGSREGAITWTDNKGNLWLFGGWSYDTTAQVQYYFDELWEYNPSTNQWAWMSGSSTRDGSACIDNVNLYYLTCGEPGVYGTVGTPAAGNIPGGRASAGKWTDSQGNFWLFSGSGFDVNGNFGDPNDLWEFNPSTVQWTWMGGNNTIPPCDDYDCSGPAVYGTLGTPATGNIPLGRDHSVTWADSSGNLWLFGGGGEDIPIPRIIVEWMDDLWEFNPSTNQWALMGGNIQSVCGVYCGSSTGALYGDLGVPAPGDGPGSRFAPAGWTDSSGNFWLFGGQLDVVEVGFIFFNDLWEYQPSTAALPTTAAPTFSVAGGSYATAQAVTLNDATNGAFIYYTIDGTTPTISSTVYLPSVSQPLSILYSETLKAIAFASGCQPSAVVTETYTLPTKVAAPIFNPPGGTYSSAQAVAISDTTPGVNIFYTTDGTMPTESSPELPGGSFMVSMSETVNAVAVAYGYGINSAGASPVVTATYTLNLPQAAAPTFSLPAGTYSSAQTVTLTDATNGATIYYTTNGTTPTTSSTVYAGPITVSSSETIEAIAMASGDNPSAVTTVTYTIPQSFGMSLNPTSMTVAAGASGTSTITVQDEGGFNGNVSFACSGLPSGATCSFTTLTAPTPAGVSTTTLTVATSATTAEMRRGSGALLPGAALVVVVCCFGLRKRRRLVMLVLLGVGLGVLGGCGGAGSGGGGGGGGSQPMTSTVTVTATSGTLQQTATFTLTVN